MNFLAILLCVALRTEYLTNPDGIEAAQPRLQWRIESAERGQRQTAYRILVASAAATLAGDKGDLWDTGKVMSDATSQIAYAGRPLVSGQQCFWKVQTWDKNDAASKWSEAAKWSMGLLKPEDWKAQWISFKDETPLHADRAKLFLPPARHYRKEFAAKGEVKRAILYGSALGIAEFHLNGQRVGDAYFEPGWADYRQRDYYRGHDVTKLVKQGGNCIGAIVADGWYAGYVGYGLLVGYGPNKTGRAIYGKTPALFAQLDIEFADGSHEIIGTDATWQTSGDGPIREADLLMGESYDARHENFDWCRGKEPSEPYLLSDPISTSELRKMQLKPYVYSKEADWKWKPAIRAEDNGSVKAKFFEPGVEKEVELGFQKPAKLVAYTAPPIRVVEEIAAKKVTEPKPGAYIFDLGENIAGVIRLKVKGAAGTVVQIRYGEMLHKDGRLMTENLRKARATDFYTLRGDANGEKWQPRFTYHGFQFVEVTGLAEKPTLDAVTGLVLSNDTPAAGEFACSDPVMTQFWKNTVRTQRANFIELPTDCPQRDERLGWSGDAQIYARTASYNADVAAFFTKWIDDLDEAQRDSGAFPDYAPYPFAHGKAGATHGAAWTDVGVIVPCTIWKVYGDRRVLERHWASMTKFMEWRRKADPELKGVSIGNTWGDWLNVNEATPIEYVDLCYHRLSAMLMSVMADALAKRDEAAKYRDTADALAKSFRSQFVKPDGSLSVDTQTAYVLALEGRIFAEPDEARAAAARLAEKIARNDTRMATGFLGTKPLLLTLTVNGQTDLALRLFQSRRFPSWGYEVEQGATSVWERWDSFTKEHGFNGATGKNNAAMNSFSHYSFGAVMQWAFQTLAGIDTDGPGYRRIVIRPNPPSAGASAASGEPKPIDWVKAHYDSIRGRIGSEWRANGADFELNVTIPANTTATIFLPAKDAASVTEGGKPLSDAAGVKFLRLENSRAVITAESGNYRFASKR